MESNKATSLGLDKLDVAIVRSLLQQAHAEITMELDLSEDMKGKLKERCEAVINVLVQQEECCSEHDSPAAKGMRDVDAASLCQQVYEAHHHLATLKATVAPKLVAMAQKELSVHRPVATGVLAAQKITTLPDNQHLPGAPAVGDSHADYPGLRLELTSLMDKLPGMRMQLEHNIQRLAVNLEAVEEDLTNPFPATAEDMTRDELTTEQPRAWRPVMRSPPAHVVQQ